MEELTRRGFVRHAGVGSVALSLGGSVPGWARQRPPLLREGRFASGVAAGCPKRRSARLWTRLAGAERNEVLGSTLMLMSLDLYPGQAFNFGQWDGFAAERRELMEHVLSKRIGGVTTVSGDIHTFFAGTVTTSGRASGTPAASEFVGGAITSEGIAQGVAEALGLPEDDSSVPLVTQQLRASNPHFEHVDTVHRGYAVIEARPEELRVDFRGPQTVLEPRSEIRTWARFRVGAETPTVVERI